MKAARPPGPAGPGRGAARPTPLKKAFPGDGGPGRALPLSGPHTRGGVHAVPAEATAGRRGQCAEGDGHVTTGAPEGRSHHSCCSGLGRSAGPERGRPGRLSPRDGRAGRAQGGSTRAPSLACTPGRRVSAVGWVPGAHTTSGAPDKVSCLSGAQGPAWDTATLLAFGAEEQPASWRPGQVITPQAPRPPSSR